MNVNETRSEMLACVSALREQLVGVSDRAERAMFAERTRRQIEAIKKRFKRKIDERAGRQFGFAVNERQGIEAELAKATAATLALVKTALAFRH
jgi:hypothetical protein